MPGSLVNARIRNVLADGLLVSFLTYFNGSIDRFHLSHVSPASYMMQPKDLAQTASHMAAVLLEAI